MGHQTFWAFCLLACVMVTSLAEGFRERAKCPEEAIYYRRICYEPVYRSLSWAEAEIECQNLRSGGHLATLRTAAVEKIVSSHFRRFSTGVEAWVGLHAVPTPTKLIWEWIDGTTYSAGSVLWDSRAPSTSVSNYPCISLYNINSAGATARWIYRACSTALPFICKYRASS
ncbi:lithostathine-like [Erythrolamprus reginae]|uniref:lithostathine-like n=1 Tax=Erythrolamprus reginae TaxID=121349 RepID=UPI00396CC31E